MHKLILLSATYRQASHPGNSVEVAASVDPENRLYWRMNRQRLEGEVIRDSLLAIGGQLNQQMEGPGVSPPLPKSIFKGASGWAASKDLRDHTRRSVYILARRNFRFPFLEVFDAPDNNLSCPVRERSTTAPQALTLPTGPSTGTSITAAASTIFRSPFRWPGSPLSPCANRSCNRKPACAPPPPLTEFGWPAWA